VRRCEDNDEERNGKAEDTGATEKREEKRSEAKRREEKRSLSA
jgi:hypothetical protein